MVLPRVVSLLSLAAPLYGRRVDRVDHANEALAPSVTDFVSSCILGKCLEVGGQPEEDPDCAGCLLEFLRDSGARGLLVGPNNMAAGYWADMIRIGLQGSNLYGTEELFCGGNITNCRKIVDFPGDGAVSVMGWDQVSKMMKDTVRNTWSGTWWKGVELGYLINNPFFWSGGEARNDPIGILLGMAPKQHAVVRPYMEQAFKATNANLDEFRGIVRNFLDSRGTFEKSDMGRLVYVINMKLVFNRVPTEDEISEFLETQGSVNFNSLISQILPKSVGRVLFSADRDAYTKVFQTFYGYTKQAPWAQGVQGKDCSPGDCMKILTQSIVDGFMFAGGLSVPTDLEAGVALLFSEHESNPYPAREIPAGKELNFWWECIRLFAPVMGFPHWEKRPTCEGETAESTANLQQGNGQSSPCPLGRNNLLTGYPPINQWEGGDRVVPHILLAQRDPSRWGQDADKFKIRDISTYIKNSLGFAEHAYDSSVAGGANNMYCPGKDLSLLIGEAFFKEFNKNDWVAEDPSSIEMKGSPGWSGEWKLHRASGTRSRRYIDSLKLCSEDFSKTQFVAAASQPGGWCDPSLIPEEKRAPVKLQGLFWLKDLVLPDVAACFGNGEWDAKELTLKLPVLENFYYGSDSDRFVGLLAAINLEYIFKFEDAELTKAELQAFSSDESGSFGSIIARLYRTLMLFDMTELPGREPGEKWNRPSTINLLGKEINRYEAWRMLDGNLQVNEENTNAMIAQEESDTFYRYFRGEC